MRHTRYILQTIVLAVALLAAGQTAMAETVTYTISGHKEPTTSYLTIDASGSATGTANDSWDITSTSARTVTLPGGISFNFGSDKTTSLAVEDDILTIRANGSTGGYITLSSSNYVYHVILKDKDGGIIHEAWNMTDSYTYRFQAIFVKTIVVEYATAIPITGAVISGINDSYFVSAVPVKPVPTAVTWHGTALTKDTHYTLSYQNTDAAGTATVRATGKGIFSTSTSVSANYTLVWTTYSVRFNKNSDDASGTMANQAFTYSTAQALTANVFTRIGYTFEGWSTTANGATAYTDGQSVVNLTFENGAIVDLYAQWTPITYNVRFNKNSYDASGTMANQAFTYNTAQALTANVFTRIGYTFDGWSTTANGATAYTDGQSVVNLTFENGAIVDLYAQWAINTYTVTLDNQGATTVGTTEVTATFDAAMPAITVPEKTGYFFGGYFTEANGGGIKYYNADGTSAHIWDIASSSTLYAQWTYLPAVAFIDENGVEQTCSYYTTIESSSSGQTLGDDANNEAWYVVSDNVTVEGALEFKDKAVHLILCDGATLSVSGDDKEGILHIETGGLHIYGQWSDTGSLELTNKYSIRGNHVTINGGTITATGTEDGINASYLTINGGTVTITGTEDGIYAGYLTINGGTVTATGTEDGIFARNSVTINGGTVTATATATATATGTNDNAIKSIYDVTINGGTVSATGNVGIYADRKATINGGKVLATGQVYGIYCHGNDGSMTIRGGNVIVTGDVRGINVPFGPITLGWTNVSDYITASSYACEGGYFSVSGNLAFIDDDGHVYSGQLDDDAIVDKTLRPYLDQNSAQALTLMQGTKDGVTAWWGTFYNGNNYVLSEGAAAYTLGSDYKLYRLGTDGRTIPRETAVVIIATEATPVSPGISPATATIQYYNVGKSSMTVLDHAPGGNILKGRNSPVHVSSIPDGKSAYVLSVDNNGVLGFRQYTGPDDIPAYKAYYVQ